MTDVPTLYVRDVPPNVYEALRKRAERDGRSINAQAIELLRGALGQERSYEDLLKGLRRSRERFHISEQATRPEHLIREDRDAGSRRS